MHKVVNTSIEVKYRHAGNVIAYLTVEFEIYRSSTRLFAVPRISVEDRLLLNLPVQFSFRLQKDVVMVSEPGLKEVVKQLVENLKALELIEEIQKDYLDNNVVYGTEELLFV